MMRQLWFAGVFASAFVATALAAEKDDAKSAAGKAGFEQMKKLAGTWVMTDEKGQEQVVSVIKVTAAGSAIHETLFPGSGHEMISVYHLDGPELVMTHYCALGNQPQMKLDPSSKKNQLNFKFSKGANIDPAKDMHMHEGSIVIVDDNHIESNWQAWAGGKPADGHKVSLKLTRKKDAK